MDMQQVKMVVDDDIDHGAGEGGLIGGVIEEGIGGHPDFVIENICIELIEADGLLIGNKMHLVALVRQRFA